MIISKSMKTKEGGEGRERARHLKHPEPENDKSQHTALNPNKNRLVIRMVLDFLPLTLAKPGVLVSLNTLLRKR